MVLVSSEYVSLLLLNQGCRTFIRVPTPVGVGMSNTHTHLCKIFAASVTLAVIMCIFFLHIPHTHMKV